MTAVQQMLKELQEKFPRQMADMYDSNQLLLEDIALKAKKMEKEEKIEFALKVCIERAQTHGGDTLEIANKLVNL